MRLGPLLIAMILLKSTIGRILQIYTAQAVQLLPLLPPKDKPRHHRHMLNFRRRTLRHLRV